MITRLVLLAGALMALGPAQAIAQKKQRDLITRAEIESSVKRGDFIYALIRSLRPHFLEAPRGVRVLSSGVPEWAQPPGRRGSPEVEVFIDQGHAGGVDVLRGIQAERVEEVRYLDASKAIAEYGVTLGAGGAIVIKLYKEKPPEKPTSPE